MDDWYEIKCEGCGFTILQSENVKFCHNCGHKLPEFKPTLVTCPCCNGAGRVTKMRAQYYHSMYPDVKINFDLPGAITPKYWNKGDTGA